MKPEEQKKRMEELRQRMKTVPTLPDEPNFPTDRFVLERFLRARDWKVNDSEKLLKSAVEWRRSYKPLTVDCKWCHERPGFHCMRQVGFDREHRPVIYSCFAQAATHKNVVEDSVAHCSYLLENAQKTTRDGLGKWVWVMDCTGMTMSCCNPKLGYGCAQIFANCYPETLGLVIVINHSSVFQGVWRAIKIFLDPNTLEKVVMERKKEKVKELFQNTFTEELNTWLLEEIKLNKEKPLKQAQVQFWKGPQDKASHDPRGTPSFVSDYIVPFIELPVEKQKLQGMYKPHPNIVDTADGSLKTYIPPTPDAEVDALDKKFQSIDVEDEEAALNGAASEIDIPDEYKITAPAESTHL